MTGPQPWIWKALGVAGGLFRALPHPGAVRLGGLLGRTVARCTPERVERAVGRCERFLAVDRGEARRIVLGSYDHFGRSAAEFLRFPALVGHLGDWVTLEGEEHLRGALDRGKGVVLLTAHLGSWEMAAGVLAERGFPMNAIGAQQRDPRITDLIAELRLLHGVVTVGKGFDLKTAIQCLREGRILGILLDQDARDKGLVSPFLGAPASTPVGPVKLAHKLGAAVVPLQTVRLPDGVHHRLTLYPPLEDPRGIPFGEDAQASVDRCNGVLSRWIREHPDQWMWMYPRWATTLGDR